MAAFHGLQKAQHVGNRVAAAGKPPVRPHLEGAAIDPAPAPADDRPGPAKAPRTPPLTRRQRSKEAPRTPGSLARHPLPRDHPRCQDTAPCYGPVDGSVGPLRGRPGGRTHGQPLRARDARPGDAPWTRPGNPRPGHRRTLGRTLGHPCEPVANPWTSMSRDAGRSPIRHGSVGHPDGSVDTQEPLGIRWAATLDTHSNPGHPRKQQLRNPVDVDR